MEVDEGTLHQVETTYGGHSELIAQRPSKRLQGVGADRVAEDSPLREGEGELELRQLQSPGRDEEGGKGLSMGQAYGGQERIRRP